MSYENTTVPAATLNADALPPLPEKKTFLQSLTEDWWAVLIGSTIIIGALVIVAAVTGFKFTTPVYQWATTDDLLSKVLTGPNLLLIAGIGVLFAVLSSVAIGLSGGSISKYLTGFSLVFVIGIISLIIAGNKTINYYGVEYVVFALLIGLLIGNLTKIPDWLREAARSEFFIKTGLVILGSSILFTDIVKAGLPGILQAVLVVSVVWFFALWLSRKLKVDDEFGVILASAVAICGVSAAIVAAGAIKGDKKKLSYVTTLVLLVAIPMMILQPWLIKVLNIPEVVGGAWLGGTLDTTATVTAAAALVGPAALKAGVIIKFSQNVLIGVAAFFIAIWWTYRKGANATGSGLSLSKPTTAALDADLSPSKPSPTEKPGLGVVWERFPKFVLGFIAASLIFSFLIPVDTAKSVGGILNSLRTVWFALAFVAIGLEARFTDLVKIEGGRPAIAFVGAQLFNILWTLIWAWLLFGGILLAAPDIK
ncbi:putative sulfate exporter family transporter [Paraflavitalea soli]|uniref:Putative sulfate exporter family transporter n=1 Tax=Paraflavitalea soli TaxID=2315862 RepID=A0A3B7MDT9_9BACT|nr:putative sulfate exporter family transporter [Paraflavitalea soli]AXY72474.1 putative sulfate exporter family transporter [Paraflavitalea soli]